MTPQPKYLAPFKAFLEKLQSDVASVAFAVDVDEVSEWRGFVPFELDALEAQLGYSATVARKDATNARRAVLTSAFLSADYPAAVPAESKAIWGGAASAQRLYAVTQFLVWMCDHPYAAKVVARRQCAQDLDWLKLQFFDENMRFDWPQVTLATIVRKQRVPAALIKRLTPSDELAVIVGKEPLPRTEVVSRLWAYIKKNKLQDAVNKRMINADPNL